MTGTCIQNMTNFFGQACSEWLQLEEAHALTRPVTANTIKADDAHDVATTCGLLVGHTESHRPQSPWQATCSSIGLVSELNRRWKVPYALRTFLHSSWTRVYRMDFPLSALPMSDGRKCLRCFPFREGWVSQHITHNSWTYVSLVDRTLN